jgi:RHS repeat-associated protein
VRVLTIGNGQYKLEFTSADGLLYQEVNLVNGQVKSYLHHGRCRLADLSGDVLSFYYHDPLGSPVALVDGKGVLLGRSYYTPYGACQIPGTELNTLWFTGKPYDEKTGRSYFGARWYDPELGRFTAIDPVDWHEAKRALFPHRSSPLCHKKTPPLGWGFNRVENQSGLFANAQIFPNTPLAVHVRRFVGGPPFVFEVAAFVAHFIARVGVNLAYFPCSYASATCWRCRWCRSWCHRYHWRSGWFHCHHWCCRWLRR